MQPGDVVSGRFEILSIAGAGGMGEVWKGQDLLRGEPVAVKVLIGSKPAARARFEREAEALSELRHPGIVQYVAHGETPSGESYLAMEWLEGEDLASRLKHGRLTVAETIALGLRLAEPLGAAHARGIVHRDLKPSNLFLVRGGVDRVKVLDFGIAWLADTTRMTQTGIVLGTPGYMSPEQARTGSDIDARADVFSLGCVLFECLTGVRAFVGEHLMALLAKILFEEVPRPREIRADVPPSLDALVSRMLAKEPARRPRHGLDVAEALSTLDTAAVSDASAADEPEPMSSPALTAGERRLLSVVLLGREQPLGLASTQTGGKTGVSPALLRMRKVAEASGCKLELLVDDSVLVTLVGSGIATDLAAQAARCALALRELAEGRRVALSTGWGKASGKLQAGDAIDRAARILVQPGQQGAGRAEPGPSPIAIDEVTAGLLDRSRFSVREGAHGKELLGEIERAEETRTLLGKAIPCIGRDRELATLRSLFKECTEEPMARIALVTAAAGVGKTRLALELIREVKERYAGWGAALSSPSPRADRGAPAEPSPPLASRVTPISRQSRNALGPAEIWFGRGDPMRVGSPFSLLGQVMRGPLGIREGEPLAVRQQKLRAWVARHVIPAEQARVAEFLGELVGTPFPDDDSPPLRAARKDAQLMGEQMRRAWEDLLAAECAEHPTLIVLDDLHWGDLPTVRFIGTALANLKHLPWMVLGLARPEVHEMFPKLWVEREAQQIRLDQLTRRASERLVKEALGPALDPETMDRLVEMADGNAFYLEELIRAVAEGKGRALPKTVVAMVDARLSSLETEARRVLRAASVFGEVFWLGGVEALLGGARRGFQVLPWISLLLEREILVKRPESRFPPEPELAFRHALLREGAYASLTEEDRTLGHKLAATYLEEQGESDPMVLAEHYERGRDFDRAGSCYLRAAEQAMRGGDTDAAIARAKRGLSSDPPAPVRAALLGVLCESYVWRNDLHAAAPYAEEVIQLATPGSAPWARAVNARLAGALYRGARAELLEIAEALQGVEPGADAASALTLTLAMGVFFLDSMGQFASAEVVLQRLTAIAQKVASDPVAWGWYNLIHTFRQAWVKEDPCAGLRRAEVAYASLQSANHPRGSLIGRMAIGVLSWVLGAFPQAERALRDTMVAEEEFGMTSSLRYYCFIEVLAARGALDEASREAARLIEVGQKIHGPLYEGHGRWASAGVLRRQGELVRAEHEVRAAIELLSILPMDQMAALATLADIQLAQGQVGLALETAEEAMRRYEGFGVFGFRGGFTRLVHAEALAASGDRPAAARVLQAVKTRLLIQAERIDDAALRRSFLEDVPEHARIFALSQAWSREGGA